MHSSPDLSTNFAAVDANPYRYPDICSFGWTDGCPDSSALRWSNCGADRWAVPRAKFFADLQWYYL